MAKTKTVVVDVVVRLFIETDDNTEISEVIQEMDYNFVASSDSTPDAEIVDTEIRDFTEQYTDLIYNSQQKQ